MMDFLMVDFLLAFPMTMIEGDKVRLETIEGSEGGGVAMGEVFPELSIEAPVEMGVEGLLVPAGLGGESLEGHKVSVDMISFLHLEEG